MLLNGVVAVGRDVVRLRLCEICPFLCIISMRRELRSSWERCSTWGPFGFSGTVCILCIYLFAHVLCLDGEVGWCWDTNQKGNPHPRNPQTFQAKPKAGVEFKSGPHILPEFQAVRTMLAWELISLIPCAVLHRGSEKTTTQMAQICPWSKKFLLVSSASSSHGESSSLLTGPRPWCCCGCNSWIWAGSIPKAPCNQGVRSCRLGSR